MKLITSFLFSIVSLSVFGQNQADTDKENRIKILLKKMESKTISEPDKKELRQVAFEFQNKGQLLDYKDRDYKGSLSYINKAIIIFNSLNDTLNIANNRKFKGYLLGRFGKFAEAKNEIQVATDLFKSKNADWGVAVSQFDLSKVYEFEYKIDSAIYYCNITIEFWKSKDTSRMFISQNLLLNLLLKSKKFEKAKLNQKQFLLEINSEFDWHLLLDFYFLSMRLYKETKEINIFNLYQNLYSTKIAELKQKGISAKAFYDDN